MNRKELTMIRDLIRELVFLMPNTPTLRHGATKPEPPPSNQALGASSGELRAQAIEALNLIERELETPPALSVGSSQRTETRNRRRQ
jgi:hypothetical protein